MRPEDIAEAEGRDDHDEAGAHSDEHVGPQACSPAQAFTLNPYQAAENSSEHQASDNFEIADHGDLPRNELNARSQFTRGNQAVKLTRIEITRVSAWVEWQGAR